MKEKYEHISDEELIDHTVKVLRKIEESDELEDIFGEIVAFNENSREKRDERIDQYIKGYNVVDLFSEVRERADNNEEFYDKLYSNIDVIV